MTDVVRSPWAPVSRVRFADGSMLEMRPVRETDGRAVAAFAGQLSRQSEYRRFLTAGGSVRSEWVQRLIHADQEAFLVEGAFAVNAFGPSLVAVAESVRTDPDDDVAEFALTAADGWQRLGVGTMLAQQLAGRARVTGVRRWEAFMLADNRAMARVMHRVGPKLSARTEGTVLSVVHELADVSPADG